MSHYSEKQRLPKLRQVAKSAVHILNSNIGYIGLYRHVENIDLFQSNHMIGGLLINDVTVLRDYVHG